MLGRKDRDQLERFMTGSLRQLVPDDHILARVDQVLELGWLREEVADLYCADNGRPGIDPEVAVRLMLAGFLLGIVHDRRLLREAQVNLAIRWFTGYGLHEILPDHSSLTRIARSITSDSETSIEVLDADQVPLIAPGGQGWGWLVLNEPASPADTVCVLKMQFAADAKGTVDALLVLPPASAFEVARARRAVE